MCISLKIEFVHIIIVIHNIILFHWSTAFDFNFYLLHSLAHWVLLRVYDLFKNTHQTDR